MSCTNDTDSGFGEPTVVENQPVTYYPDIALPDGTILFKSQVSGHSFDLKKKTIGMLQGSSGRVFKPILKDVLGEREVAFYKNLQTSSNSIDMKIQRYTPTYYRCKEMRIFDKRVKFIELENITDGMTEPCIMDIKIGRRTWDPLAPPEKRASEDLKYVKTKTTYGFSITGFQVYRIPSGKLERFDKSYGNKLDERTVVEAFKIFLNGTENRPPCRELVVGLLSTLWKIQSLFRTQRRYRFYSSSILLVYDAKRLRQQRGLRQLNNSLAESVLRVPVNRCKSFSCVQNLNTINHIGKLATPRVHSKSESTRVEYVKTSNDSSERPSSPRLDSTPRSPKVNRAIHRLKGLKRSISLNNCEGLPEKTITNIAKGLAFNESKSSTKQLPDVQVRKLCRTHSYSNNFDTDIVEMKEDYANLLLELSGNNNNNEEKHNWARVCMIDFAHVFPAEDAKLDENYLEGIENLVKIFEMFIA